MAYNYTPVPPVRTKPIDYAALVKRAAGKDWNKPEPAYEFSNGRKFDDTGSNGGPYRR
jgi:hypothetical protein